MKKMILSLSLVVLGAPAAFAIHLPVNVCPVNQTDLLLDVSTQTLYIRANNPVVTGASKSQSKWEDAGRSGVSVMDISFKIQGQPATARARISKDHPVSLEVVRYKGRVVATGIQCTLQSVETF